MNILVVGGGGREHALAWKSAQSSAVETVYVAPGNAGMEHEPKISLVDIAAGDIDGLREFAQQNDIALTIVGPENPLVDGIVDTFEAAGLKCLGPNKAAAQLEGSKAFSKDFLKKYQIPTAEYGVFSEVEPAEKFVQQHNTYPVVIKADGLAAGKGVIIAEDEASALQTIHDMLEDNRFGDAGARVVIESFLQGEEVSFICIADGEDVLPMATSQDHKRRDNDDKGPNTGGMGACSPSPLVDKQLDDKIMQQVIMPTLKGMLSEGIHYRGFLYAGLMIDAEGNPKVLEFNCRFGDPETQPIMMRLKSDLVSHCLAAVEGRLSHEKAEWEKGAAVGVVMASKNYPDTVQKGDIINGLNEAGESQDVKVFFAGVDKDSDNRLVASGGRVLCVCAKAEDMPEAKTKAYEHCRKIGWESAFYRTDIADKAIKKDYLSKRLFKPNHLNSKTNNQGKRYE